jgi:hypothetical protein
MRFKAEFDDAWALIPGPFELDSCVNTDSVREIAGYAATDVARHAIGFAGLTVKHDATLGLRMARRIPSTKWVLAAQTSLKEVP